MIFRVTYYSGLRMHCHHILIVDVDYYQVKMLVLYSVQTTGLTFDGKKMRYTVSRSSKT
jgi:hypothetical protein